MAKRLIHVEYLKTLGTDWKAKALTTGTDYYSDPIRVHFTTGYTALLVKFTQGSDDVDINYEVSIDGKNFHTPYDSSGNSLGKVITDGVCLQTTRANWWIVFSPQIAEYVRFMFAPDATSKVTCQYIQQEEV